MPDGNDQLALILWRLERIEELHNEQGRWRRQITGGLLLALALPLVQFAAAAITARPG